MDQPRRKVPNDLAFHVRQAVETSESTVRFLSGELLSELVQLSESWTRRTCPEPRFQPLELVLDDLLSLGNGDRWVTGCRAAEVLEVVQVEEADPR